jgi:hypothetical protein
MVKKPDPNLESAYAEMAADRKREKEALKWAEAVLQFDGAETVEKHEPNRPASQEELK